jgi:predicted phosphodiesterase
MRYAVISDIHGNAEALEAVLLDIASREIDITICLGDIVGYYADPELCVKLIQEHVVYSVAGNHDYAAIGLIDTKNFTYFAFEAMEWTKRKLSEESIDYLSSLPISVEMDKMYFVHSSPCRPKDFIYIFPNSDNAISEAFSSMAYRINFIGHTHCPFIIVQDESRIMQCSDNDITVNDDHYYLINVGSVGQPRNLDPRSCYAVYDTELSQVSLIFVKYKYTITQRKVFDNHLPSFLAERLASGR